MNMSLTLVDPRDERRREPVPPAPRLASLLGKTVALLDISKPGGACFLDRLATLLTRDYGVGRVVRDTKPTFARPAPAATIDRLRGVDAVVEGLAD
jgi:hypothetical protein